MLRAMLISTALIPGLPLQAGGLDDMVHLDILPGWRNADGTHVAALHLSLAPGWKTFWRAPGDAGIPARFHLEDSHNLAGITPVWPTPQVFDVAGMRTIGYNRELVLPLRVTAEDAGAPISLQGQIELGVCRDVCVPALMDFAALLPVEGANDLRIRAALIDVPYSAAEAGVTDVTCAIGPVQYGLGFRSEITMPRIGGAEVVVIEPGDPMIWVAETRSWWEGPALVTETEMSHVEKPGVTLDPADIRITVIGAGQAVEISGCPTN